MPSLLQSFASFFSGAGGGSSSGPSNRRRQTITSTADAFSLPTHSPIIHEESPRNSQNPTFQYPPQQANSSYDYVPSNDLSTGLNSRSAPLSPNLSISQQQSPILPLHNNHLLPGAIHSPMGQPYPPLSNTWNRLRTWLNNEYNELGDTLNYGVDPAAIADVQLQLGLPLPSSVRESYLCCDGQEVESSAGCSEGLFFGLTLLPLEDVIEEWRFWREVDEDVTTGANPRLKSLMKSIPEGYVRKEYSCRGWLPLVTDRVGNYLGVDLHPGDEGSYGQVIIFGRDFDTKVVMWKGEGEGGWARWLLSFVEELENGEGYEMGAGSENGEGSEDEIGYESYFFGSNGPGKGDGAGEGNSGGLRLTGQYRGWNVLEAWADRSLKRWVEAGLYIPEPADQSATSADVPNATAIANPGSATEVAIPILAEIDTENVTTIPPHGSNTDDESTISDARSEATTPATPRMLPPTISVTMPPAPQPVLLPTKSDFTTSQQSTPEMTSDEDSTDAHRPGGPGGLARMTSEDSASMPLVGDVSFGLESEPDRAGEHDEADRSMMEATLLPASVASALPDGVVVNGSLSASLQSPIKPSSTPSSTSTSLAPSLAPKEPAKKAGKPAKSAKTKTTPSVSAVPSPNESKSNLTDASGDAEPANKAKPNGDTKADSLTAGGIRLVPSSSPAPSSQAESPAPSSPVNLESPVKSIPASTSPLPTIAPLPTDPPRSGTPDSISSITPKVVHKRPLSSSFAKLSGRKGVLPDDASETASIGGSDKEDKKKEKKEKEKEKKHKRTKDSSGHVAGSGSSFTLKGLGLHGHGHGHAKSKKEKVKEAS